MHALTRRQALFAASACATTLALPPARAQGSYPHRPIQLVHGFGAGGNADVVGISYVRKF